MIISMTDVSETALPWLDGGTREEGVQHISGLKNGASTASIARVKE